MPVSKTSKLKSQQFAKRIDSKTPKSTFSQIKTQAGPYLIAFIGCAIVGSIVFKILGTFMKQDVY